MGGIIGCGGAAMTWLVVSHVPLFTEQNSEHYVSDPVFVTCAGAVVCILIASAFVVVFDTVSDTMIYCFASEGDRPKDDHSSQDEDDVGYERGRKEGALNTLHGALRDAKSERSTFMPGSCDYAPPSL